MEVKSLSTEDQRHFEAAQGWLILGDYLEANEELERIAPLFRAHPDVLALRWAVYARAQKWDAAFEIARTLVDIAPDDPAAWLKQAACLRKMKAGGPKQAWDSLLPVADKFPHNPALAYALACYACQSGKRKEAWTWLEKAIALGSPKIKLVALDDKELEPLWVEISEI